MNPLLVTLILGTATPGGVFPVYGEAFADMVNAQEPARAIHWAEAPLAARLAQARETTMANTASAAPNAALIHPGVRKYLREIGL